MTRVTVREFVIRVAAIGALVAAIGCGEAFRTGRGPTILVVQELKATSGATGDEGDTLSSDVRTVVTGNPTIFSDHGAAVLGLVLKNPGTLELPTTPSPLNAVTINRYRVEFKRGGERNTPGVDVPFGFDGAVTATIPADGTVPIGFLLVSHAMKQEQPLMSLRNGGGQGFIHTLALISGPGASKFADTLNPFGLDITIVSEQVGAAATRKLLRSVVYKGFAAVMGEAVAAGKALGLEHYIREQIGSLIGGDTAIIDRFLEGSKTHALRRSHELDAVVAMLIDLQLEPVMSKATLKSLQNLVAQNQTQ